mgnify:CR=1 FL=1
MSGVADIDRDLAQSIVKRDVDGIRSCISNGAKAHMSAIKGISWAFLPLALDIRDQGGGATSVSPKSRACVRALIDGGAPVKGLAHLVGAGVDFDREDFNYFLDNWLWRDADEIRMVAKRVLADDDLMAMLAETGHLDPSEILYDDVSMFEHLCKDDMHKSIYALGLAGADVNSWVGSGEGRMSAVEYAASHGNVMTVNALVTAGAYYDEHKLVERMSPFGDKKVALMRECILGFEHDQPVFQADLKAKLDAIASVEVAL